MTDDQKSANTIAAAWGIIDAERDANKRLKERIAELEAKLVQLVPAPILEKQPQELKRWICLECKSSVKNTHFGNCSQRGRKSLE